jgi:hypothetical protein
MPRARCLVDSVESSASASLSGSNQACGWHTRNESDYSRNGMLRMSSPDPAQPLAQIWMLLAAVVSVAIVMAIIYVV